MQHLELMKWGFFLTSLFISSYHLNLHTCELNNKYIKPYRRTFKVTLFSLLLSLIIPSERAMEYLEYGNYSFYLKQTAFLFEMFAILFIICYLNSIKASKKIKLNQTRIINKDATTVFLLFNILVLIIAIIYHTVTIFI